MEKILFFSIVVSSFFLIFKFVEMKYIEKEWKPAKIIIRDIIMVFIASFLGFTIFNKSGSSINQLFDVITDSKSVPLSSANVNVFTDNPNF
tara:strand:+ start:871 stop:1143 length:273 start_codon:yes stop_codon:yes gene_type:complete